ncbi:14498_t:CDS:2 [Ambispora leptoticha]|uniref:14498_t:CDS:1 n=1 Tax=Ambispora leptoticha TaxID=144679 RepID=A0A9N8ZS27_9GLOM|nr:14498_t:CDS:2 [Ambispora leptoticha]
MAQNTAVFNVGGTRFEINADLIRQYPNSLLAQRISEQEYASKDPNIVGVYNDPSFPSLFSPKPEIFLDHNPLAFGVILDYLRYKRIMVPRDVAKEVVELQLREFGIPYESLSEEDATSYTDKQNGDDLPSYESVFRGVSSSVRDEKTHSLRDTVEIVARKRLDAMIQDVILPCLKRHAKRGHQQVAFYLTPHNVTPQTIAGELTYSSIPHEWIYLPNSPLSNSSSSSYHSLSSFGSSSSSLLQKQDEDELPDLRFLLQKDTLKRFEDLVKQRSGVRKVDAKEVEVSVRTENEFGLIFTKSFNILEVCVQII